MSRAHGAKRRVQRAADPLTEFLHDEAAGGVALMVAAVAALVWANAWSDSYASFWDRELTVGAGSLAIHEDLQHWVNDGLMALFFFVVGLEIKRELVTGELRDRKAAALPVLAALGGAILPAAIFVALTAGGAGGEGWGIPMATDIAFAVGVLALLGDRVSSGVKLLVLTIAIVDDVVAILVIALFYSDSVSVIWLLAALAGLVAIVLLRRAGVARVLAYVPLGVFVWVATYESGIHATIAGVALALLTPARPIAGRRVLEQLEHRLHPVTSFAVVPVFALANAGVVLNAEHAGRCLDQPGGVGDRARAGGRQAARHRGCEPARCSPRRWRPSRRSPAATGVGCRRARGDRLHRLAVHHPARLHRRHHDRPRQGRHLRRLADQRPARRRACSSAPRLEPSRSATPPSRPVPPADGHRREPAASVR